MNQNLGKFYRICIEGNIGCGKTSLLCRLIDQFGHHHNHNNNDYKKFNEIDQISLDFDPNISMIVTPEPIKLWTNIPLTMVNDENQKYENLLQKMYTNPKRWAFTFEHYCQLTRFNQMSKIFNEFEQNRKTLKKDKHFIHLMERSIYSNRFGFVENFSQSGELSPVEYRILDQYFDHLRSKPPTMVNLFVYLRTDPEVVHERIRKRSRREEDAISMEYLRKIHKLHEKLFIEKPDEIWNRINCAGKKDQSVIVIDGNHSFDIVYENFIDNIRKWLQKSQMIHTDVKQPPPPPSPQQQQQKQRH
ncbi:deoxynucleoside kinase-like [Dermatophagoides pteronyssinus]|uniref:deoxynucleoside kinase-like n=1 Tax=Dermatophagoides pteronyssinus TaxID=6956 RepID=UPI003F67D2C4